MFCGELSILDHILKFSINRWVLKEYQVMLIFRGEKMTIVNLLHKEIGGGDVIHSEVSFCGTVTARIAFTVHHWYLLTAPFYCPRVSQDLLVRLHFTLLHFLSTRLSSAYAWESQAGLSSTPEFLCPERMLPNILTSVIKVCPRYWE